MALTKLTSIGKSVAQRIVINSTYFSYTFATLTEFKTFDKEFPDGKVIKLLDRGASFIKITGTGSGNDINIIASIVENQSIQLISESSMTTTAYGMVDDVDAKDILAVAVNDPNVAELIISQDSPVSGSVKILRDNITIRVLNRIKRVVVPSIPIADRAIFMADGRDGIRIFADFDLMGEGTRQIGVAGLVTNTYTTTSGRIGINGPANSAIYFLRCTNSFVRGSANNTAESGYIFRNCGNIDANVSVENICGSGVEISTPNTDESVNPMPLRDNVKIVCRARYVNDLKLGAGNAIAVSVAGSAVNEVFRNYDITVIGYRNAREIHHEFNSGSKIEGFVHYVYSRYCLQGAVVTQGIHGRVYGTVINGGSPGAGAINSGYVSMYGYLGSTNSDDVKVDLKIVTTNDDGFTIGTTGSTQVGSNIFIDLSANFPVNIEGKPVTIEAANPSGAPLEAYVVSRDSPTQLTLDLPAHVLLASTRYGYGTGLRNPLLFQGAGSVQFDGSEVQGGVFSNLPGEPAASAVLFKAGNGASSALNMKITAPSTIPSASAPAGLEVSAGFANTVATEGTNPTGFLENYKGWSFNSAASRFNLNRQLVQDANPDTTLNTFGTPLVFTPRKASFESINDVSVELDFDGAPVGQLTAQIEAFFIDGGTNMVEVSSTTDTTKEFTTAQKVALHRDNQKIVRLEFKVKSDTGGRQTDRGRLSYIATEG